MSGPRNLLIALVGVLVGLRTALMGVQPGRCRGLGTHVWYDVPLSEGHVYRGDAEILRLDVEHGRVTVTILAAEFGKDEYFTGSRFEWASRDEGETWERISINDACDLGPTVCDPVQAPSDPKILYRRLEDLGLYLRSEDGGRTWRLPKFNIEGVSTGQFARQLTGADYRHVEFSLAAIHPLRPLTLYAAIHVFPWAPPLVGWPLATWGEKFNPRGLYASTDGGEGWTRSIEGLADSGGFELSTDALGISPLNPDLMFGWSVQGLVKSVDGGKNWVAVGEQKELGSRPISLYEKQSGITPLGDRVGTRLVARQFAMDPRDQNVVYIVSNKGIYRTLDGGETWCLLDLGFDMVGMYYDAAINPLNPQEIFVGTGHGVFRSEDRGCDFTRVFPPGRSRRVRGVGGRPPACGSEP